jgi:hypothetical protein
MLLFLFTASLVILLVQFSSCKFRICNEIQGYQEMEADPKREVAPLSWVLMQQIRKIQVKI